MKDKNTRKMNVNEETKRRRNKNVKEKKTGRYGDRRKQQMEEETKREKEK